MTRLPPFSLPKSFSSYFDTSEPARPTWKRERCVSRPTSQFRHIILKVHHLPVHPLSAQRQRSKISTRSDLSRTLSHLRSTDRLPRSKTVRRLSKKPEDGMMSKAKHFLSAVRRARMTTDTSLIPTYPR